MNDKKTMVQSRRVLIKAERINAINGHENLGFLSEQYGFTPKQPPLLSFPSSHKAWDEIALQLPKRYETLSIREAFLNLPLLDADAENLEDPFLLRAALFLGVFAHAYYRLEEKPPESMPVCLMRPWEQVCKRLGRKKPFLAFYEHILYNWKFRDPKHPVRALDHLDLLIKTVDHSEESLFYLWMLSMTFTSAPLIGAVVRAQEAVQNEDIEGLKHELEKITKCIEDITDVFMKVNANPHSDYYLNPLAWSKYVAILSVPWEPGIKGPGGISAPFFGLIDSFIGRRRYTSLYGQDQIYYRRVHNSVHVEEFLEAVEKISVKTFIEKVKDPRLTGLFYQLIEAYAGEQGLLFLHERKIYAYLPVSFKVGRSQTTGGTVTVNPLKGREWEAVKKGLEMARLERDDYKTKHLPHPTAYIKSLTSLNKQNSQHQVSRITLDIQKTGIHYQIGDHFGILPENNYALIEKTLKSLKADKNASVYINEIWHNALKLRPGYTQLPKKISLIEFLQFAKIRPLTFATIKALYEITLSPKLQEIIESDREDQLELWEAFTLISTDYDVTKLWKSKSDQKENISHIVPPETFRLYSIASAPIHPDELSLTIGALQYRNKNIWGEMTDRYGTASNFMVNPSKEIINQLKPIPVEIFKSHSAFTLPKDPLAPLVIFAGGTGISPFISIITERLRNPNVGMIYLFYSIKTTSDFYYQHEIEQWMHQEKLQAHVVISNEDKTLHYERSKTGGYFVAQKGSRSYLDQVIHHPQYAKEIFTLLQHGYFYICGSGSFSDFIYKTLKSMLARYMRSKKKARIMLYTLIANNRYMQDIFTTYPSAREKNKPLWFNVSEIALHNNDEMGYWIILNEEVFDVSEFIYLHPGGDLTITSYAGMDATHEFQAIQHHENPSINAMLNLYKIGIVKKLHFEERIKNTLCPISAETVYADWVSYLYLIIEIENIHSKDLNFYEQTVFSKTLSPEKSRAYAQMIAHLLNVFLSNYFSVLVGEKLESFLKSTDQWSSLNHSVIPDREKIMKMPEYNFVVSRIDWLAQTHEEFKLIDLQSFFFKMKKLNIDLIKSLKKITLEGIEFFEAREGNAINHTHSVLSKIVQQIPLFFERYLVSVTQNPFLLTLPSSEK